MCGEKTMSIKRKKILSYVLIFGAIPLTVIFGTQLLGARKYVFLCFAVTVLCLAAFFVSVEHGERTTVVGTVLVAVMTALSVVGRFAFSYVPFFKPVTAFVIIAGVYLGAQYGFLCGALSALVSNFIFGQGAWTPFQMFAWGMIGFFSGLLSKQLIKSKLFLYLFGAFSGVAYSLFLDTWTAIYVDGTFVFSRYLTLIASAVPVTAVYIVSNVIFLILLFKPIGRRLSRITTKYGLYE